jgi:glycosyltransferase involved in cell wall biosynthesis
MTQVPVVSVIMSAYNHAPYVAQAIQSVLDQTFENFEFLIADDGSSDATQEIIAHFRDVRITFFPHAQNRGACIATNELIEKAQGKYVAILNSDDYWSLDKLAYQVDFLEKNTEYAAIFGNVSFIDKEGKSIPKETLSFGDVFEQANRSQGEWLRRFFDLGNCLCHPSILIRRSCYTELGLYNNCYRQSPDFDMWIRLVKKHPFFVSDKKIVSFRITPGENASSQTPKNALRGMNEHYLIMSHFFEGMSAEALLEGFSDLLIFKQPSSDIHVEIEKTLLFFSKNIWFGRIYQVIGLKKLFELFSNPLCRSVLKKEYQIDDLFFQERTAEAEAFKLFHEPLLEKTNISVEANTLQGIYSKTLLFEIIRRLYTRFT